MLLLSLASHQGWKLSVLDVPGAFLHTLVPEDEQTHILVEKLEAELLVKLHPEWTKFVLPSGEMLVLTTDGLYGLPQSPKLWFDALSAATKLLEFSVLWILCFY